MSTVKQKPFQSQFDAANQLLEKVMGATQTIPLIDKALQALTLSGSDIHFNEAYQKSEYHRAGFIFLLFIFPALFVYITGTSILLFAFWFLFLCIRGLSQSIAIEKVVINDKAAIFTLSKVWTEYDLPAKRTDSKDMKVIEAFLEDKKFEKGALVEAIVRSFYRLDAICDNLKANKDKASLKRCLGREISKAYWLDKHPEENTNT